MRNLLLFACVVLGLSPLGVLHASHPQKIFGPALQPENLGPLTQFARVVVFRGDAQSLETAKAAEQNPDKTSPAMSVSRRAVSLYVNEFYHTALLPEGVTQFCVPAGIYRLSAIVRPELPPGVDATQAAQKFEWEAGKVYWVRLDEPKINEPDWQGTTAIWHAQLLPPPEALPLATRKWWQINLVSRLNSDCKS